MSAHVLFNLLQKFEKSENTSLEEHFMTSLQQV